MPKQIYLVRHGEPEEGYTRRFLGRMDPTLSPEGRRQAGIMAERIALLKPELILSSPLRRASETGDIIAAACALPLRTEPLLLEIDFGKLEGMTFKEASAAYPGITDSWQALSGDFSFPGGEKFADFNRRCRQVADGLKGETARRIVLVAHGGVLRGVLCNLLAIEADGPLRFRLAYAALTTVELYVTGGVLTGFNVGRTDTPKPPVK